MSSDVIGLWGEAVSYINQRTLTDHSQIGIYLNYLKPETVSESELIVSTDNSFAKSWIERYYFPDIKDAIFNVIGRDLGFRIVFSDKDSLQKTTYQQALADEKDPSFLLVTKQSSFNLDNTASTPSLPLDDQHNQHSQTHYDSLPWVPDQEYKQNQKAEASSVEAPPFISLLPSIPTAPTASFSQSEEDYKAVVSTDEKKSILGSDERTFDSFIVGDSNQYAYNTALGVAKSPGNIYNPLFLYGKSGLGKTHLLVAVENYIKINHPYLKTTYAQTSDFFSDFTSMFHDKEKRREFEQRYYNVDVILLDDVQYLEGKEATTNEVFRILNTFIGHNKQIVLSADRPPYNIAIDERHTSRYASGATIDIQPPSFEVKYAIFENYLDYCCRKIDRLDLKEILTKEIIDRVIELSSDNIRELNGATASLVAYLSNRQNKFETLTIEEVEKRVLNVFMKSPEKRIDISNIQKEVENFFKVSHSDLISKKRSQGISYPRQIAMYLARNMTSESYPDIGKAFGGKDHTSVMYACNQIEKKRQLSKKLDKEIESLIKLLKG